MIPCRLSGAARRTVWTAIEFQHPTAVALIATFGMTVSGHAGATECWEAAAGDATTAAPSTAVMIAATRVRPRPVRGPDRTRGLLANVDIGVAPGPAGSVGRRRGPVGVAGVSIGERERSAEAEDREREPAGGADPGVCPVKAAGGDGDAHDRGRLRRVNGGPGGR